MACWYFVVTMGDWVHMQVLPHPQLQSHECGCVTTYSANVEVNKPSIMALSAIDPLLRVFSSFAELTCGNRSICTNDFCAYVCTSLGHQTDFHTFYLHIQTVVQSLPQFFGTSSSKPAIQAYTQKQMHTALIG